MLADLVDYSDKSEYDSSASYNEGDVVLYQGYYYKAKKATSALPSLNTDWEEAPKFSKSTYNDLWNKFLGRYLALLVVDSTIPPRSTQVTAAGTVKINGEEFEAAKEDSVLRLQNWVSAQIRIVKSNMHHYLVDSGLSVFSNYKGLPDEGCTDDSDNCTDRDYTNDYLFA